jgi:hypothetical protein
MKAVWIFALPIQAGMLPVQAAHSMSVAVLPIHPYFVRAAALPAPITV